MTIRYRNHAANDPGGRTARKNRFRTRDSVSACRPWAPGRRPNSPWRRKNEYVINAQLPFG